MSLSLIQFRVRDLRAGAPLGLTLATDGPGVGHFEIGHPGARHGLRVSSPLGEPLFFNEFRMGTSHLTLVAAADLLIFDVQAYAEAGAQGLRGWLDAPPGVAVQVLTGNDRTTVVEQSSWWVLFEAETASRLTTPRNTGGSTARSSPADET